jgi:hypothetical protein
LLHPTLNTLFLPYIHFKDFFPALLEAGGGVGTEPGGAGFFYVLDGFVGLPCCGAVFIFQNPVQYIGQANQQGGGRQRIPTEPVGIAGAVYAFHVMTGYVQYNLNAVRKSSPGFAVMICILLLQVFILFTVLYVFLKQPGSRFGKSPAARLCRFFT